MKRIVTLAMIAALLNAAACFATNAARAEATRTDIEVRAGEHDSVYYYAPADVAVHLGVIRVTFVNEGARQHTFNVKRRDEWRDLYNFPLVQPGERDVFEFELWEPGDYVFYCQLYKHVDHGQTGVLRAGA
jgi:plastocyanin